MLQIEINPSNNNVRLIGSKELGGQLYDNGWKKYWTGYESAKNSKRYLGYNYVKLKKTVKTYKTVKMRVYANIGYTGEYDGRTILIPNVSDADFDACASYEEREALMFSNAKVIVDSGMKVTETLDSEVAVLTQLRTQYTNNPAALEIIDNEIAARTEISQTIKDDCHQGSGTDGDVGDASAGHAGHSDTWMGGWVEEQFVDYDQAVTAAGNWNAKLSGLTDMSDLEAALEAANLTEVMSDVPSTGGGTETVSTEIGSEAPTGEIIVDTPIDTGIATV